jgi:hypothetical protein
MRILVHTKAGEFIRSTELTERSMSIEGFANLLVFCREHGSKEFDGVLDFNNDSSAPAHVFIHSRNVDHIYLINLLYQDIDV